MLKNKAIIITGAGRGIGRSAALACARAGAHVLVNDLGCDRHGAGQDPACASAVVTEIRAAGGTAEASWLDVTAPDSATELIAHATRVFGRVDGLVHCAGVDHDGSLLRTDAAEARSVLELQALSAMGLSRAAAEQMVAQGGGGSIVLTTSPAALFGARNQSAACAAGAAVVGFIRAAAIELKRHGIRVNALAPTARTRLTEALPMFTNIRESSMTPDQTAPATAFLLSDLSATVTGEVVGAAGGRIYVYRIRETSGVFLEDDRLSADNIAAVWQDVVRDPA